MSNDKASEAEWVASSFTVERMREIAEGFDDECGCGFLGYTSREEIAEFLVLHGMYLDHWKHELTEGARR